MTEIRNTVPTFLGIGAQKAGTTWLSEQLSKHSDIWMAPTKELHYFSRSSLYPSPNGLSTVSLRDRLLGSNPWERKRTLRGTRLIITNILRGRFKMAKWFVGWFYGHYDDNWYVQRFSGGARIKARGEITPAYAMLVESDVAHIHAINPDMKLIFMMRHPADRAWSQVRFDIGKGLDLDLNSIDQIVNYFRQPHVRLRGDYQRTIDVFLKRFGSSQFLIGFYDAIKHNPVGLLNGITDFLGVDKVNSDTLDFERLVNPSRPLSMPQHVKEFLLTEYAPEIQNLSSRFGSYATAWDRARQQGEFYLSGDVSLDDLSPVVYPNPI